MVPLPSLSLLIPTSSFTCPQDTTSTTLTLLPLSSSFVYPFKPARIHYSSYCYPLANFRLTSFAPLVDQVVVVEQGQVVATANYESD
jgi:hypothetical protein